MATVSIDYMFMEDGRAELGMPILVMKDGEAGMIFANVVPQKGVEGYAVKRLSKDIDSLGHKKVILKRDNEPAIVALKDVVRIECKTERVKEESPVGDHQASGEIEMANQQAQCQFRVMKCGFGSRVGRKLKGAHPLLPWLLIHAADTLSRYVKGEDGRTAYQRVKGRVF